MKIENVRVGLAAGWQPPPLLAKGWRRTLYAEQRISKPSLPEDRGPQRLSVMDCQRNRDQGLSENT